MKTALQLKDQEPIGLRQEWSVSKTGQLKPSKSKIAAFPLSETKAKSQLSFDFENEASISSVANNEIEKLTHWANTTLGLNALAFTRFINSFGARLTPTERIVELVAYKDLQQQQLDKNRKIFISALRNSIRSLIMGSYRAGITRGIQALSIKD